MTTLSEIIKTGATISTATGEQVELSLIAATYLLAAIDHDRNAMGLHGTPYACDWSLTAEDADPDAPVLSAYGLRYSVQGNANINPELLRMCTVRSCEDEAVSYEAITTTVCVKHLDVPSEIAEFHNATPRALRLDTWESHVQRDMRRLEGDLRVIAQNR